MELEGRKELVDTGKSSRTWSVPTVSLPLAVLNVFRGFGMRCSRARCGTPPILGVVNMFGTRNFTCYMGAL